MNPPVHAIPDGSNDPKHPRYDEDIERYNEIAVRVMNEEGVAINDMHAIMRPYGSGLYYDYCHLSMGALSFWE